MEFPPSRPCLIASKSLILEGNMGWPFCPSCKATLRVDSHGDIECGVCPFKSHLTELKGGIPTRKTYSVDRPIPLWAKSDEEQAALKQSSEPVRATIEEPCIKCSFPEVGYYTVQLRKLCDSSNYLSLSKIDSLFSLFTLAFSWTPQDPSMKVKPSFTNVHVVSILGHSTISNLQVKVLNIVQCLVHCL